MRRVLSVLAPTLLLVGVLAACGGGSSSEAGGRTVDIDMQDIKFSPTTVSVKAGESVQFVFHNKGAIPHDAFVGDDSAQMSHDSEMSQSNGMEHGGGHGSDGITVDPGKTGTLTHTFDKPGGSIIGCHQPGHYAAGMKIDVTVT